VHKVPESLTPGEAAYIEPAACAWHAVDRGEIQEGDTVVISGVGNIGLCMLQIAKLQGAGRLVALDAKPYRLELARQFGAGRGGSPLLPLESGRIRVLWPPMLPKDDVTEVQNQIRLVGAGLRSHRTAMDALGTENPEEELARVQTDRAALGTDAERREGTGDDDAS
jgi:hypothetical protein